MRSLRLAQPWLVYFVAGSVATGVYFLLPFNTVGQAALYDAIGASSVLAVLAGTRICRPAKRAPWYLFAVGLAAFTVGDVIFNLYAYAWHKTAPSPSVADGFYLAGYPFLAGGLALLILGVRQAERRAGIIDAAILSAAFGIVQWVFLMARLVHSSDPGLRVVAAYTGMDVVLLSGLTVFLLTPSWRARAYRMLALSLAFLLAADEVFASNPNHYGNASWNDTLYLMSYVVWGTAALHPSMALLSAPRGRTRPRLSSARLAVLAAALLTAPFVLVLQKLLHERPAVVAIAIGASLVAMLSLARLGGLVRAIDGLRREERAARSEADSSRRLVELQNEQLRDADRLKDEFVALISHDLRTPLTSIMGYLELVLDSDAVPDAERGYLEVVDRNSERLLRLVNDLLFVARFEAGEMDLNFNELELGSIVRQAVEEALPRAAAKEISLAVETDAVPAVMADRGRMYQLLDNLIGNALKFTPEGGQAALRLRRDGDVVRLEVEDSGIGIAPDDQRHLFERFFRAANTRDGQIPGTGLGLYIARAIVEAHGGKIGVDSRPGEGTCFRVELPLVRDLSGSASEAEFVA
jgi:signal transduction histidine kinase